MWLGAHQAINEIELKIKLHWIYKNKSFSVVCHTPPARTGIGSIHDF
jgi:hypothetical protein